MSRFFALFLCIAVAARATIYTTDGSLSDVTAKVALATDGDIVNIPAGTFTWGTSGAFVSITHAITLQGASTASTTINLATTGGTFGSATIRASAAVLIQNMTITQPNTASPVPFTMQNADGWRITGVTFVGGTSGGYFAYIENAYGVIDHCDITGGAGTDELIFVRSKPDSWTTASSMGTANAVYIENCTFRGLGYVCDFNSYGRGCIRFCTITGQIKIDGHGKYTNTPARGVRQMEVYQNTWTQSGGSWAAIELRGGTGMVFQNTATGNPWLLLQQYEVIAGGQTSANYPIDDQIGVGEDPKAAASEPMYLWSNRRNGDATTPWPIDSYTDMTGVVNPDRDYYMETGGTFNGSSGVGIGTHSAMVAITPSHANVGFWVTDQGTWNTVSGGNAGQLYVWSGSAWTLQYTPYTYPHPLDTAGGSGGTGGGGGGSPVLQTKVKTKFANKTTTVTQ